jgi:hypothetical protein
LPFWRSRAPCRLQWQALSQRAAGDLHTGRVGRHAGHRQAAVVAAVGFQFLLRHDAGLDQRRIEGDRVMTVREEEAVAALPFGIFRFELECMTVGDSQDLGHAERLADVALSLHFTHPQRIPADSVSAVG